MIIHVDNIGASVRKSTWGTYRVLGHTLRCSTRVALLSLVGKLQDHHVEAVIKDWCSHIFRISELTLESRGLEKIDTSRPHVLVSHHVSLLDTPCILESWPNPVRMIAKKELRSVPVFGRALEEGGNIFIDRKNLPRAIEQLQKARPLLDKGTSLWVAAQGSRSRDGRLGTFKKGAFHVAVQLQVPILPVWIQGTLDVIPPDQWAAVSGQRVIVNYGTPIPTTGKTVEDLEELMAATRIQMLALAKDAGAPDDVDALADVTTPE